MPRSFVPALLLLVLPVLAFAQAPTPSTLRGKFQDAISKAAVANVEVELKGFRDTSEVHRATSRDDGTFAIEGLTGRGYRFAAKRLGYALLRRPVRMDSTVVDLGTLELTPVSIEIGGVSVNEAPAPATQKADTTEYHADAVKVHKDATVEDLVQKLPGVTMENGQIKAQGEAVQQVLVNGRPFFGSDPSVAMRNLPADVVDRIQVYDRMSDQAEFSGFDDNQSQKTMNFILRDRKAQFGKVYGGYGDQDRYQGGGNATWVRGATRLTLIGMSNNVNQKNFSPQDLFGAMSSGGGGPGGPRIMTFGGGPGGGPRGPGGGGNMIFRMGGGFGGAGFDPSSFFVGQQPGISTTHSGGLNYVGQWGKTLAVTTSVFVNDSDNDNAQTLSRQYLPPQDSIALYDQSTTSDARNGNERFDGRFEWTPDSLNSVILQPRLYFQRNDTRSLGDAANTTITGVPLSAAHGVTDGVIDGDNLSSRLTLRHRFGKRGRNVSADVNAGHSLRDEDGAQYSTTASFDADDTTLATIDQRSNARTRTNSFSTRIAFTEPVRPGLQLQAIYNPSISRSDADARTFSLDPVGAYTVLDSALTNRAESRYTVQSGGLAALLTRGAWKLLGNLSGEHARLESDQRFPGAERIERSFDSVLPSITLTGTFANRRNLRLAWNTSTTAPTIGQLQDVVNNSNPLSLTTGNPDLRPTYNHSLSLRISEADPVHSKSRFVFLNVIRTSHAIGNATFTAPGDTTIDGVFLARGVQLTHPVNLVDSWNANAFGVYSRPASVLKSIVSVNGGLSFSRTPSQLGDVLNVGRTWALRGGVVLSSNISPNLDFTVSYWGTWNLARNTLSAVNRGDYYTHSAGLRLNSVVGPGIVVRQELTHNLQSGVPSAYGQDVVLWNTTVGKKVLNDDRGEIRLTATDVLDENRAVSRSITESYVQDSRDRTLSRYLQAVFTYTFK